MPRRLGAEMATYFVLKAIICLLSISSLPAAAMGSDGRPIRVTTIQERPYLSPKEDAALEGNARFEGYIVDLLEQISSRAQFTYALHLVADRTYGAIKQDGRWSGMIGEIVDLKADLAAAPITVSENRAQAVDFTVPFMKFGSAILMKKPRSDHGAAGSTTDMPLPTITAIRDLANQDLINYGVIENGRTADFFRRSSVPAYSTMWRRISTNSDFGTVPNTEEGVELVRKSGGRYAFIVEGTAADYWIHQPPCDLVKVDGHMDNRSYALAVRRGSDLKPKIDAVLRQMERNGELRQLHTKWWIENSKCSGVTGVVVAGSATFVVIIAVLATSLLIISSPSG